MVRRYPGKILAGVLAALLVVPPAWASARHATIVKANDLIARIQEQTPDRQRAFVRSFERGFYGRPTRKGGWGASEDAAALGRQLADGTLELTPYNRGWLAGATESMGSNAAGLRDGRNPLQPRGSNDDGDLETGPVPNGAGTPLGGGPARGGIGGNGPLSPTARDDEDQSTPTPGGPNKPDLDPNAPNNTDTHSNDDDGGGSGLGLGLGLAALGGLGLLALLLLNKDHDDDAQKAQGFADGLQAGDAWPAGSNPITTPGNFTPSPGGPATYAEAARLWAQERQNQQARQACADGLMQMMAGLSELAGALAAQAAETSAMVGQSEHPDAAAEALRRAQARISCGAAVTRTISAYKVPGYDANVCRAMKANPVRIDLKRLANINFDELPAKWQRYLSSLGPNSTMLKEAIRVLTCRQNGGSCTMNLDVIEENKTWTSGSTTDPGAVCGGNSGALTRAISRPFGLAPDYAWPLQTCRTSSYGYRPTGMHHGTDMRARTGTSFRAIAPGRVVHAGPKGGYGNAVVIRHDDGSQSLYGHIMDGGVLVKPGEYVDGSRFIGRSGNTGHSRGPHIHLETRIPDGRGHLTRVNPEELIGHLPGC